MGVDVTAPYLFQLGQFGFVFFCFLTQQILIFTSGKRERERAGAEPLSFGFHIYYMEIISNCDNHGISLKYLKPITKSPVLN